MNMFRQLGVLLCVAAALACTDQRVSAGGLPILTPETKDAGTGTPPSTGTPPVATQPEPGAKTWAEVCERYAEAFCSANQTCCPVRWRYPTEAACVTMVTPDCLRATEGDVFRTGKVTIDLAAATRVMNAYAQSTQKCEHPLQSDASYLIGHVPAGGDCSYEAENTMMSIACEPGLACEVSAINGTRHVARCVPRRQLGEGCAVNSWRSAGSCVAAAFCDVGATGFTGVCAARRKEGQPCSYDSCVEGLLCESEGGAAARCVRPAPSGNPLPYCRRFDRCSDYAYSGASNACSISWHCEGAKLGTACTLSGNTYRCSCLKDSVVVGEFESPDLCKVADVQEQAAALSTGCGWGVLRP